MKDMHCSSSQLSELEPETSNPNATRNTRYNSTMAVPRVDRKMEISSALVAFQSWEMSAEVEVPGIFSTTMYCMKWRMEITDRYNHLLYNHLLYCLSCSPQPLALQPLSWFRNSRIEQNEDTKTIPKIPMPRSSKYAVAILKILSIQHLPQNHLTSELPSTGVTS